MDYSKTNKWNEMLADLGIPEEIKPKLNLLFDEHENKICVGEDINIFIQEARQKLGLSFQSNYDMTRDFVNRFEVNKPISKLIRKLKKDFMLGLLTNQYPGMLSMIIEKGLMPKVDWDVIIDSSLEKIRKPDPEIYLLAENKVKADPKSILFVDNKQSLLEPARKRGWQVFEYDPSNPEISTTRLQRFIYNQK